MAEGQISNTYVLMGRAVYLDDYGVSCGERRTELYRCRPPVGVNNDVKVSIRVCLYLTHAGELVQKTAHETQNMMLGHWDGGYHGGSTDAKN